VPKVLDFVDMDSQKWADYARYKRFPATLFYALESAKLVKHERRLANAFDFCATISSSENETLHGLGVSTPADWFPNGVDIEYFSPPPAYDENAIAFVGRMDYYPNQEAMTWFCDAVWPLLRSRRGDLTLRIVGAEPPRSIRALARLPGVEVTGSVPDVRPRVGTAAVSVAPLRIARGLQNKVLECMALGVPAVVSERVARGLGLGSSSPIRVADTPEAYAEHILAIAGSGAERHRLSLESRALVEQRFSWPKALEKLDEILDAARGRAASAPPQVAQHR
jgi:sugar transferase (PEP-CTERM/EpsH1 system associated)